MKLKTRRGFTLPEVLLATALSVLVFFALGTLLSRSFSIWYDGMAQWKLATAARVTRIRLLDGGFGKGTGLLSATNHTIDATSGYTYVKYYPVISSKEYRSYGWISTNTAADIWLYNIDPAVPSTWAYGQSVKNFGAEAPDVKVNRFNAEFVDGNVLQLTYTLRSTVGGKVFEQSQTVRALLLNSN